MTSIQDELGHVAAVDAWLARSIDHASSVEIIGLFRRAYEALWSRAVTTLGSVTLTAITDRARSTAIERYPFLSEADLGSHEAPHGTQRLRDHLASVPRSELIEGLRFGLVELLSVIGRLMAEILSPELHAALRESTPDASMATPSHVPPADVSTKVLP